MAPFGGQLLGDARYRVEAQVLDHQEGGQGNEDAVDDKEVKGAEEKMHVQVGQPVAGGTQRRHEGGGDGYPGEHCAALFAAAFQDAGQAAEKGDNHVVDGGGGAGFQLRGIHQRKRREDEEERGGRKGNDHHYQEVLGGRFEEVQVVGSQGQAHADDGAHEGRDQHGADDDRRGVDIEPHGSQHDGESQNPDIGPAEPNARLDALGGAFRVHIFEDIGVIPNDAP